MHPLMELPTNLTGLIRKSEAGRRHWKIQLLKAAGRSAASLVPPQFLLPTSDLLQITD